jgi:uncharacterized protein (DUF427 family)
MTKAIWNGVVLAESDRTVVVEGNHYFPPEAIRRDYFRESDRHTTCYWKGRASHYHVEVDGQVAANAAWYYPDPSQAAAHIRDHVAFYRLVTIEK